MRVILTFHEVFYDGADFFKIIFRVQDMYINFFLNPTPIHKWKVHAHYSTAWFSLI